MNHFLSYIISFLIFYAHNSQALQHYSCKSVEKSAIPFYNPKFTIAEILKCLNKPAEELVQAHYNNRSLSKEDLKTKPVILLLQGGPSTILGGFDNVFSRWKSPLPAFWVHQSQTLYPEIMSSKNNSSIINSEKADFLFKLSVAILQKVIEHFKQELILKEQVSKNKTAVQNSIVKSSTRKIYILSHSLGSLIAQRLMAEFKNSAYQADKIVLTAGRILFPTEFISAFQKGYGAEFTRIGNKQFIIPLPIDDSLIRHKKNHIAILTATLNYSYISALNDNSLDHILYVTAKDDLTLGSLNEKEEDFLTERGAKIYSFMGTHSLISYKAEDDPLPVIKNFLLSSDKKID